MNNEIFISSWTVGLTVDVGEDRRADFRAALEAVFESFGEAKG